MFTSFISSLGWTISAILTADLGTGIMHWFEDSYLSPQITTGIGMVDEYLQGVAKDNDRHHIDPCSMLKFNYLENLSTSIPPIIGVGCVVAFGYRIGMVTDLLWWGITLCLGGAGNIIHRFAHTPGPEWIQTLQRFGLLQSIAQHKHHHYTSLGKKTSKDEPLTDYCVITTVLNPVLDNYKIWRKLENLIKSVTKIKTNHETT